MHTNTQKHNAQVTPPLPLLPSVLTHPPPAGIISLQQSEVLLQDCAEGSFWVRVSKKIWKYTFSYRSSRGFNSRKQLTSSQIHKIRDPLTNRLITEPKDIERTFHRYYEKLYAQPESAQREEMKTFLDTLDLPKIGQTQNDALTRDISIEEVVANR